METDIGHAAGTIWQHLNQNGETTLSKLKKGLELPDQLLLMGLGWLGREGKVCLAEEKRSLKVALRESSPH